MDSADYDKTLFFLYSMSIYELIGMSSATDDDILAKKIDDFLEAFTKAQSFRSVEEKQTNLLSYLDHASEQIYEM